MKKLMKKDRLAIFLESCGDATFCSDSLAVIASLLSERKSLGHQSLTENVLVIKQEKLDIRSASSVLISRMSNNETEIKVTSREGIDTLQIKTSRTPQEICLVLKRSQGMDEFAVRINSSCLTDKIIPQSLFPSSMTPWNTSTSL